jgi:hypothetical protein
MAGAYTATPDVPEETDLPPGWNVNWPHPGPWPPGYTPDLGLGLEAQATMAPGSTVADITATLTDQGTFVTSEPATQVAWTAAWNDTGLAIGLKLSGEAALLASVSVDYTDVGSSFWGATPDFEFDISESDAGRSFTLLAASTPFSEHPVSASAVITVLATVPTHRVEYTITANSGHLFAEGNIQLWDGAIESPFDIYDSDPIGSGRPYSALNVIIDGSGSRWGFAQGAGMYVSDDQDIPTGEIGNTSLASGGSYLLYAVLSVFDPGNSTHNVNVYTTIDGEETLVGSFTKIRSSNTIDNGGWLNIQIVDDEVVVYEQ